MSRQKSKKKTRSKPTKTTLNSRQNHVKTSKSRQNSESHRPIAVSTKTAWTAATQGLRGPRLLARTVMMIDTRFEFP